MIVRARIVLPISRPPIEDGAVQIADGRIVKVGRWPDLAHGASDTVTDLGDGILLPGLINAHCHLDYTTLAGQIPPPKRFTDWIKAIVALKAAWSYTDFADSWLKGARMLLRHGVTTVADIEAIPELLPDMWQATPLPVISFRELIGLRPRSSVAEWLTKEVQSWSQLPGGLNRLGLSPHATYTTSAEVLRLAAAAAREHHWPLATHVAESEEEFEMFMFRHGPLFTWLKGQRDMSDCGQGSPVQHLERCGYLAARPLVIHANYLWRDDAATLARRKVSVVHCPRSHAYFRHLLFPRTELSAAGVNICLGTDSLASVLKERHPPFELSLFAEMQAMAAVSPDLSPAALLQMATINGARALGQQHEAGELTPGARADMIAVPFAGKISEVSAAAVQHRGPVSASMIAGRWVIPPNSTHV